jgi:nuclear transport factor 2 (NTF2) superfamily protein
MDTSWRHAFDIVHSPSLWSILSLGLLLLLMVGVWLAVAQALYDANFGSDEPLKVTDFARRVFTSPEGHRLIVAGNTVGFVFAVLAFCLSVVSFPLLLDRNVGVGAAIATSFRVILRNPGTMILWAIFIAGLLVIGSLPFFLGLAIVVPILGHSTWHLYRKVIEPDPSPRPQYEPKPRRQRYAADFPAALFVPTSLPQEKPGASLESSAALARSAANRNPATIEEARDFVSRVEQLFMPWNIDALVGGFTEDCIVRFGTIPEFRGREALRRFFGARSARQKGYRLRKEFRSLMNDVMTNVWEGEWEDAETGRRMKGYGVEVWTMREGKIAIWEASFSTTPADQPADVARMLG